VKTIFVIRNQNGHYLGRNGEWLDGSHVPALFRTEHRDVAVNELVEVNLRDFDLRGEIVGVEAEAESHRNRGGHGGVRVAGGLKLPASAPL
jgi:hypothetical protein